MLKLLIGAAGLVGLVALLRKRGAYGRGHCGHGGHWRRHEGGWYGRGFGFGPDGIARFIATRIEATDDQRRLVRDEVEKVFESTRGLQRELRLSRDDFAKALRTPGFDEEVLGEAFGRQDDQIREVRKSIVGALAHIHDALDERQRKRLADLIERRGGGW